MLTELSTTEIAALVAENQSLKAENEDIKADVSRLKSAVVTTLVEFGIVNDQLQPQKVNKFKLAKKVGGIILSAMDGETSTFLKTITETATPLIEKYKQL
jgi:isopentenyl phosphate kinase